LHKSIPIVVIIAAAVVILLYVTAADSQYSSGSNKSPLGEATITVNSTSKIPLILFKTVGQREAHLVGTATISLAKPEPARKDKGKG
jgi:hypothetical protein